MPEFDLDMMTCDACQANHMVADLDFPEPDDDTNTQYGWLVACCPTCGHDINVPMSKVSFES